MESLSVLFLLLLFALSFVAYIVAYKYCRFWTVFLLNIVLGILAGPLLLLIISLNFYNNVSSSIRNIDTSHMKITVNGKEVTPEGKLF